MNCFAFMNCYDYSTMEIHFELDGSRLNVQADRAGVVNEVKSPAEWFGAIVDSVSGDERKFTITLTGAEKAVDDTLGIVRRYLNGSGVILDGEVC